MMGSQPSAIKHQHYGHSITVNNGEHECTVMPAAFLPTTIVESTVEMMRQSHRITTTTTTVQVLHTVRRFDIKLTNQ
jgi:hypothetical protein